MNTRVVLSITLLVVVAIIGAFLPASRQTIISEGVDSYNTHRLLFGDRTLSQEISFEKPLLGLGLIMSDIRNTGSPSPIHIEIVRLSDDQSIFTGIIPSSEIRDDRFATILLDPPIAAEAGKLRIDVSVPDATQASAIGWRYDPNYTPSSLIRYEKGRPQAGTFAVSLKEEVPLWQSIATLAEKYQEELIVSGSLLALLIIFTLLVGRFGWRHLSAQKQKAVGLGIVICLAALTLNLRLDIEENLGGVSGGDPYNYLSIAARLTKFKNPFEFDKRLPGYPILLIPAVINPTIDAHTYMRSISSVAAAFSIILVYLLARSLLLPWPAAFTAAALLAFQRDFFETSLRSEPYTVYACLLLLSLVLFFNRRHHWQQIVFGITIGYAAMTRQEGFLLAAILLAATISQEIIGIRAKHSTLKKTSFVLLRMFLPAFFLVLPFFVNNAVRYGNPVYTPYFEGERLQIVDSFQAFSDASISTWSIISSMWKRSWTQEELILPYDSGYVSLALFGVLAWWIYWMKRKESFPQSVQIVAGVIAVAVIGWAIWLTISDPLKMNKLIPILITGITIAAPLPFLASAGWRGILVTIVLASQILIAIWFHPFAKHYQQSYPLICLMIAAALMPRSVRFTAARFFPVVALIPFVIGSLLIFNKVDQYIDAHNLTAALDSVLYRAARTARSFEPRYAIEELNLPAAFYLPISQVTILAEGQPLTNDIHTIIDVSSSEYITSMPQPWKEVAKYRSQGKDDVLYESRIYVRP
ncbi:MAG: hypothetical protein HYR90_03005 [Candidatus Andersenbacteria bacterium]|nr:hypothetical protein [Candidatus Andersenbacteria bacterium]MBI3250232.1 hypothetical protein [Candidatus Andersenbacteria bacterium]